MKLFIDTNVLLRFYLADVKTQFADTKNLMADIESGQHRPYISSIVLLEIIYVLKKVYKVPKKDILKIIASINKIRGLTIINRTNTSAALKLYQAHNVKFADCLIVSQVPQDMTIVSYDKELSKLSKNIATSADLI